MIDRAALAPCVDDRGCLTVLAVDHRDALRVEFDPDAPEAVPAAHLERFKIDVVTTMGASASAVMLDPEYSIEQVLLAGLVPDGVGVLCALEAQGYLGSPDARTTHLLEGWNPARVAEVGASAAKLLLLYRHDRGAATEAQDELVRRVVAECGAAGVPLFLEPVPYELVDGADRERVVLASAERLGALGPDVLKMPFPASPDEPARWEGACRAVNDAIGQPWAVLSWGVSFDVFVRQVQAACAHGCSGFMGGRAIWRDAVQAPDRAAVLRSLAADRFRQLIDATAPATPIL